MKSLLWREYRLNRWILVSGGVAILLSYAIAALSLLFDVDRASAFFVAYVASSIFSAMMLTLLGGNAIAGERTDRSAEFMAYLPFGRRRMLASKLFFALSTIVALCIVNLLILIPPVETWPVEALAVPILPERFHWTILLASASVLIYGVSWCVSSFQVSPSIATFSGLVTAFLSSGPTEEPHVWFPFFPLLGITVASGCFILGSRNFIRAHSIIARKTICP